MWVLLTTVIFKIAHCFADAIWDTTSRANWVLPTLKQQLNLRPQWQYQDTNTVIFSKLYLVLKFKSIGQGKIWFDSQIVRRDFFFSLFFLFLFSLLVTNWMQFNFYIPNPTFTSTFINLASFSLWPRYLLSHPDVVCQGIWKVFNTPCQDMKHLSVRFWWRHSLQSINFESPHFKTSTFRRLLQVSALLKHERNGFQGQLF